MTFLVPLHPQNRICISCGTQIGFPNDRKRDKRIKIAHPLGRSKQLEIFLLHDIITDHKHHMLCTDCFNEDINQLNICTSNENDKPSAYDELIQYMIKYNKKKILIDKEKNDLNRTDSSLYNISAEECQILCGLLPDHISDIARIIHQNPQHIFEFFTICRQSMNQRAAAVFFGYKTHASISSHFNQILGSLSNDFVPIYIGSSAFTRTDIQ
ncbi:unnamed protein product [Rotaria sordida]|uniref:Uncharacterized protein n=2 Tax=Rotaria sordida TaxID=392033 RepID=A0A815F9C2_9BILA|nr:unnamed protein product [Rotaria sordida]